MPGRDLDWRELAAGRPPVDCVPVARHRSALHPLHLGHHREPQGRHARQRRPRGRRSTGACGTSTASSPARCTGRPPTSAGWWVTPTSCTARCSTAAPRSCTRASRSARPTPGAFWRVIAQHGVRVLFTAPTAFRAIKREDPEGEHIRTLRSLAAPHPVPGRRALRPDTLEWAAAPARRAGHRPLVADRDRLGRSAPTASGWGCCRSSPARAREPVPGYDVRVLDDEGQEAGGGRDRQRRASSCRCRRAHCRRSGTTTRASGRPTSTPTPATT